MFTHLATESTSIATSTTQTIIKLAYITPELTRITIIKLSLIARQLAYLAPLSSNATISTQPHIRP